MAVAAAILGVASVIWGVRALDGARDGEPAPTRPLSLAKSAAVAVPSRTVEVPDVVGAAEEEARLVLETAGFEVRTASIVGTGTASSGIVSQEPEAGTLAMEGSVVTLHVPASATKVGAKKTPARRARWVVCVDPGHQAYSDSQPEPIGPGSKSVKPAATGGTTGVETGIAEYEIVLQISMNLQKRLEERGVKVVMTRTTNDVALSNAQRAAVANRAKADVFVRVHADGSPDSSQAGISTLYPGKTKWTGGTTQPSKRAARLVQTSVIAATGAVDRGLKPRKDIAGFNYAKMPSILVECGFLSNPVEDRLLASPHYQDKLAIGLADGIVAYLKEDAE